MSSSSTDADPPAARDGSPVLVDCRVVRPIAEFRVVHVAAPGGVIYALNDDTEGVNLNELRTGQRLSCWVSRHGGRVLLATSMSAGEPDAAAKVSDGLASGPARFDTAEDWIDSGAIGRDETD